MATSHQFNPEDRDERPDGIEEVPFEQELIEEEQPRRAASAQFIVDSDIGSEAALREAMDPANQSLAEALRLSYRVLQIVMVVLVAAFFASGIKTVGDGQSGVLTRWGDIIEVGGEKALSPGLKFSAWPYPIGQFIIFDVDNRQVTLREPETRADREAQVWQPTHRRREPFWPDIRGTSLEHATEAARVGDPPRPGRDGYLLTRDADIAHMRLSAVYEIDDPVEFVKSMPESMADRLVELAVQRATVHVAAVTGLQDLIDLSEDIRVQIQDDAQQLLNEMNSGITLKGVAVTEAIPALAIRKAFGDVQAARVEAERTIENAQTRADRIRVRAAGEGGRQVFRMIQLYEEALHSSNHERADRLLADINAKFDSDEISGEVASIIQRARAYRSHIESSLGSEARRFASLLPIFREHPELVIRREWLDAYSKVLSQEDAEVFFVPRGVGGVQLALSSLHEVKELRQKLDLDRREMEAYEGFGDRDPYIMRGYDMVHDRPGRQLRIEDGRARSLRRDP